MPKKFIGIRGLTKRYEARALVEAFPRATEHTLLIGTMVDYATLEGQQHRKHPLRYPAKEDVVSIFPSAGGTFNVVCCEDTQRYAVPIDLMYEMTERCGSFMHGIQLNASQWPSARALSQYKERHPDKQIILQVSQSLLESIAGDPDTLAIKIRHSYNGLIEYVMINDGPSFGIEQMRRRIDALQAADPQLGIGIAGIDRHSFGAIVCIAETHPDISLEMMEGVRTASDDLDINLAIQNVTRATRIF